jgi:hypothetical protein
LHIRHNWWQLKTFLEDIGYSQVQKDGLNDSYLFFTKGQTGIGFEKSNNISVPAVRHILRRINLSYEFFVMVFYRDNDNKSPSA